MISDKDYAASLENEYAHANLINETAYVADTPTDYYFDAGYAGSPNGDVD
jgi:hypothetical protein